VKMSRDYGDYSSSYSLSAGILEGERKLVVKTNELAAARRADYESFRNAAHSDEDQLLSCTILTRRPGNAGGFEARGHAGGIAKSRSQGATEQGLSHRD